MGYLLLAIFALGCVAFVIGILADEMKAVAGGALGMTVGLLVGLPYLIYSNHQEHNRLLAQCLADGKKEYECVALLKSSSSTVVPVPIIIPTR